MSSDLKLHKHTHTHFLNDTESLLTLNGHNNRGVTDHYTALYFSPTHQQSVYQVHIIWCGTTVASDLLRQNDSTIACPLCGRPYAAHSTAMISKRSRALGRGIVLLKLTTEMKHRAASLRQQTFLFPRYSCCYMCAKNMRLDFTWQK